MIQIPIGKSKIIHFPTKKPQTLLIIKINYLMIVLMTLK